LDWDQLFPKLEGVDVYTCDVSENTYTPGYCGVKTIPCFLAILNGVPQPIFQSSDTMKVVEWMKGGFKQSA
jgi:hypothetical protein